MSKRRKAGDVVIRTPGSGFIGSAEPEKIKLIPEEDNDYCVLECGDKNCREWADCEVVDGPYKGQFVYHMSECQMKDVS